MQYLNSTDIHSVSYQNGQLYITFKSGGIYCYEGVPVSLYQGLVSAKSHGKYFHSHIKGKFIYHKVDNPDTF